MFYFVIDYLEACPATLVETNDTTTMIDPSWEDKLTCNATTEMCQLATDHTKPYVHLACFNRTDILNGDKIIFKSCHDNCDPEEDSISVVCSDNCQG